MLRHLTETPVASIGEVETGLVLRGGEAPLASAAAPGASGYPLPIPPAAATSQPQGVAWLVVMHAPGLRQHQLLPLYPTLLDRGEIIIGREPSEADVVVADPSQAISRVHARIVLGSAAGTFLLSDNKSTNGTYVAGSRQASFMRVSAPQILGDHSLIRLGGEPGIALFVFRAYSLSG